MFLFIFSTFENSSNSDPKKDLKCFFSEVYEFLILNEFEEMAAKYKVITTCYLEHKYMYRMHLCMF